MIETSSLRRKLLDLAIIGKLVPRTGEWKTVKLGDIAEIQLGKMLDRVKNSGKSFKYLANVNVRWGVFDLADLKETRFSADEVEKFALRAGDLLLCEGGVPGRCAIWRENNSAIKYQKAIHRIRVHEGVLPEYLQILFEAIHDKPEFSRKFTGSTIHHLPREVLVNLEVPLPPLAEQKAIVKRLEELLALENEIAADSSALDDLISAAKRKVLELAVSGRLISRGERGEKGTTDFTDYTDGRARSPSAPRGWKMVKLSDVVELISGRDLPPCEYFDDKHNYPYITGASNFENGELLINRWTDTPVVVSDVGDLLITCKGSIGELSINTIGKMHIARQVMAFRPTGISVDYLKVAIASMIEKIRAKAHGVIPGIARIDIIDLPIPLPPLAVQKAIVAKVDELFSVLDAMKGSQK